MGRRLGGKDFAPRVRSVVDRVLEKLEKAGDADKLMEAALREDYIGTLAKIASYAPKQVEHHIEASIEDFVTNRVAAQTHDSTEEAQLH